MQKIFNLLCMFSMGSFCSAADFILYYEYVGLWQLWGRGGGMGGASAEIDIYIYINMGGIYPAGKLQ